jgi:hypothetical protein
MIAHTPDAVRLGSNDRWGLCLSVESVGPDFLCRIHGGDWHVGAVALAAWRGGRPEAGCLIAEGHREDVIAVNAAERLCAATRRTVVCVAGIHFEGVDRADIDDISRAALDLTVRAQQCLAADRKSPESGPLADGTMGERKK